MTIGCNIWMVCFKLNWLFYDPSWMLQLYEFVWMIRSSVWVVFNNFLLVDATDRSKISSDQKRLFFSVSLYPFSVLANTSFEHGFFNAIIVAQFSGYVRTPPLSSLGVISSDLPNAMHNGTFKGFVWPKINYFQLGFSYKNYLRISS